MKSIFCFLFFIITCFLEAQPPSKFYTRIGGNGYDVGYDVKQTLDNGYIITGSTSSYGLGNTDMYLLKLDSMGQIKFQTPFPCHSVVAPGRPPIHPRCFADEQTIPPPCAAWCSMKTAAKAPSAEF